MKMIGTKEAAEILRGGGVVVFATDTVWGVGAYAESEEGIEKLYSVKNREETKATALLVGSIGQAKKYGVFNEKALDLAEKYWPGALTVVVPATNKANKKILNDLGGVGIRLPKSELMQRLCNELGGGVVASSANFSSQPAPKTKGEVSSDLIDLVDGVISGSSTGKEGSDTRPSTVVDCMGEKIKILRQGEIELFLDND